MCELFNALARVFSRAPVPQPAPAPQPPSDDAERWMAIVRAELGLRETPGPRSTPRIMQIRAESGCTLQGDDGAVAWCKIFAVWVCIKAGLPMRKSWMARDVEKDPGFVKLDGPAYGAFVSFWRGSKAAGTGHIGWYLGESGARVRVIGANQNDSISEAWFPKASASYGVTGYYWPRSVPLPETGAVELDDTGEPVASAV